MENRKWLKRKYPNSFNELNEFFDDAQLDRFKKSKMKIGRLLKDIIAVNKYEKGTVIQFRRTNPIRDFNYPIVYAIAKCEVGFTESGYHSFNLYGEDFEEINT